MLVHPSTQGPHFSPLSAAAAAAAAEERRKEKLDESFLNNFLIPFSGKFFPPFPLLRRRIGREGRKTFGDSNQERGRKAAFAKVGGWVFLLLPPSLPCPFFLCDDDDDEEGEEGGKETLFLSSAAAVARQT